MCKHSYEEVSSKTGKTMIYCSLKNANVDELSKLCLGQYYCKDKDRYIARNQDRNCKLYECS